MRVAFITSEYCGLPGSGGIGSYFQHAAHCLAAKGVEVEIFTSGEEGQLAAEKNLSFWHVGTSNSPAFAVHAADALVARHRVAPFDILETAELNAEGLYANRLIPEIAHVVRVHAPSVILNRYLDLPRTGGQYGKDFLRQLRTALGAWRRGVPIPPLRLGTHPPLWFPSQEQEERSAAASADLVLVMNEEMRQFVNIYWWIGHEKIRQVPNPMRFEIRERSSAPRSQSSHRLGFIGRLEPRKGIIELVKALKQVLPRQPEWSVVFAGRSVPSCLSGIDVGEMAREELNIFGERVQFLGPIPPAEVEAFFETLDLCVFPSLWESFHYTVLEAMAAEKAIIASRTGAVVDMLDNGKAGQLVNPGKVHELVEALDSLMSNPSRRELLGKTARQRARLNYNEEATTSSILDAYRVALEHRDKRNAGIGLPGNN